MTRQWYSTSNLPSPGDKVYYFSKNLGIFRGRYYYDTETMGNPHKFTNNYGIVDADDVSHWMPYSREEKNKIPLPPDYQTTEILNIDKDQQTFNFTYSTTGA